MAALCKRHRPLLATNKQFILCKKTLLIIYFLIKKKTMCIFKEFETKKNKIWDWERLKSEEEMLGKDGEYE